jgi:hypothetical protein
MRYLLQKFDIKNLPLYVDLYERQLRSIRKKQVLNQSKD